MNLNQKAEYFSKDRIRELAVKDKKFRESLRETERRVISEFLKVKVNALMALMGVEINNKGNTKGTYVH